MASSRGETFANSVLQILRSTGCWSIDIPQGKKVAGTSLIPLHVYALPSNPSLYRKTCVVLGKERAGRYTGQFNLFGGAVSDKSTGRQFSDRKVLLLTVLWEEVLEEMGVELTAEKFVSSVIGLIYVPIPNTNLVSVGFICHITGISANGLTQMMTKRASSGLEWKYQEMSSAAHFPLDTLATDSRVSEYVNTVLSYLQQISSYLHKGNAVHISKFKSNRSDMSMLV